MIALAITLATVAILTGSANAQANNEVEENYPGWEELPPNAKLDSPAVNQQTGTLADVVERGPDLQPFTPAGPGGFSPKKQAVDWDLLQQALVIFVGGLGVALVGRGLRYILSNE